MQMFISNNSFTCFCFLSNDTDLSLSPLFIFISFSFSAFCSSKKRRKLAVNMKFGGVKALKFCVSLKKKNKIADFNARYTVLLSLINSKSLSENLASVHLIYCIFLGKEKFLTVHVQNPATCAMPFNIQQIKNKNNKYPNSHCCRKTYCQNLFSEIIFVFSSCNNTAQPNSLGHRML